MVKGEGQRSSVEEDGVRVSVGHLRHVFQYVFFSDDSQQPPNGREKRAQKVMKKQITSYHTLFASSLKAIEVTKSRDTHRWSGCLASCLG